MASNDRILVSVRAARVGLFCTGLLAAFWVAGCEYRPGQSKEFGSYVKTLPATPPKIGLAANDTLANMGFMIMENSGSDDSWTTKARNTQDTQITVTANLQDKNVSKVSVHVAPGENEGLSTNVLNGIESRVTGK